MQTRQLRAGPLDSARGLPATAASPFAARRPKLIGWESPGRVRWPSRRFVPKRSSGNTPKAPAICAWRGSCLSRVPTMRADLATGPVQGHAPYGGWGHLPIGRRLVTVPAGCVSSVAAVVTAPWTRSEAGQALGRAAGVVGRCVECLRWRPRRGRKVLDDLATEQLSGAGSKHRTCTRPAYRRGCEPEQRFAFADS
jgi:hypothetical protein